MNEEEREILESFIGIYCVVSVPNFYEESRPFYYYGTVRKVGQQFLILNNEGKPPTMIKLDNILSIREQRRRR